MVWIQLLVNFVVFALCVIATTIAYKEEIKYIFEQEHRSDMITKEGVIVFISSVVLGLLELILLLNYIHNL